MKHLLLLGAMLTGILSPVAPVFAASQETTNPAEAYALEQSILFTPMSGGFNRTGLVTRLEFTLATINHLYRDEDVENCYRNIASSQPVSFERLFSDVERTDWYGKQLCVGMHAGLIQGHADGRFRPFSTITNAEAAKILAKAYGLAFGSAPDKPWYSSSITALSMRGAMARSVKPASLLTRQDMAQMFFALRNVPRLAMTPMMSSMQQEEQSPPNTLEHVYVPAVPTASPSLDPDCIRSIGNGSPGAALLILGQTAHPRSLEHHSRHVLRAQVEEAYQNGSFESLPAHPVRITSIFGQCGALLNARSPGAGLLLSGIRARPESAARPSNRAVQQQAELRMHEGGLMIDPLLF